MTVRFSSRPVASLLAALALSSIHTTSAFAGSYGQEYHGPSAGGSGTALAESDTTLKAKTKNIDYKSTTFVKTSVDVLYGGAIIEGNAEAGNHTTYTATGKSEYAQQKFAKSAVYAKGGNVMAKARSENHTQILAAGKTYIVTNEVARAMTRYTPLGTTAIATADGNIQAGGSGYLSVVSGTNTKASVRVRN